MSLLPFPQSVLAQHIIALGKTRAGKSSKLRLIVEQLLEREEPVCIIDPKGDWWGLKSSADGKHAGFPVVIFGGEHADVPLSGWKSGGPIAELVATGNRPSLIDLGGWFVGDRTRFFIEFAQIFFKLTRGRRYLVIDEVHNFAPQGRVQDPDAGKMLHWANRLASEGSGKGVTLIAASQRPQKVHKDFVTSCETLIACRVIHKLDRDAIKDWIDGCADPAAGRQVLTELASMERPEAWVWSPEAAFGPKRITFPMFSTYDSFKPQEAQQSKLKGWAEVDLEEVRTKLEVVVAEAEANDPAMLKKRIRDLEQQLKGIGGLRPEETRAAQDVGYQRGIEDGGQRASLRYEALLKALCADIERHQRSIDEIAADLRDLKPVSLPELHDIATTVHPPARALKPATRQALEHVAKAAAAAISRGNGAGEKLGKAERSILTAIAQSPHGCTRSKAAIVSGYSVTSSHFDNTLSALRSKGYLEQGQPLRVTETGIAAIGGVEPPAAGEALRAMWLQRLGKAERTMLEVLIRAYPRALSRAEMSEQSGYSDSSSHFDNTLSKLRTLELIGGRGELRASEDLFG